MTFGAYRYDTESRLLYRGGEEVPVPPRAVAVLDCLLEGAGTILSKDEILASVWRGTFVGEDSLCKAISQLRAALGDDARNPTYIQTVPRRGYRFIGRLEAFDEPPFASTQASPTARVGAKRTADHVEVWVQAEKFQVIVQVDRHGVRVATSQISAV